MGEKDARQGGRYRHSILRHFLDDSTWVNFWMDIFSSVNVEAKIGTILIEIEVLVKEI